MVLLSCGTAAAGSFISTPLTIPWLDIRPVPVIPRTLAREDFIAAAMAGRVLVSAGHGGVAENHCVGDLAIGGNIFHPKVHDHQHGRHVHGAQSRFASGVAYD